MPTQSFILSFRKNANQVLSASELKNLYLKNVPLTSPVTGQSVVDDSVIDQYLAEAVTQTQDRFNLPMSRQAYQENRDFRYEDWINWGYMPVSYPCVAPISVLGFFNTVLQINYPIEWLSSKKQNSSDGANSENYQRTINLVPLQGSVTTISGSSVFIGITPYVGYFGNKTIPNYWQITYITGFNKVPQTIIRYVALQAAIQCLAYASANITGQAGIAQKSIGIDGLNQSVTSTASATRIAFQSLMEVYQKEMDKLANIIDSNYVGFTIASL